MRTCIALADNGMGNVAPNPLVGCVIVYKGKIIGKGYHEKYGKAHAEVNAINSVADKSVLKNATLYVTLEPCPHHGKTPPCADLIIKHKIPYVIIGCVDPNPLVKGKGIKKLLKAGIDVKTGVLENECYELNKRFFTAIEKKRPYIILKWAQTADGFIDINRTAKEKPLKITNPITDVRAHTWRAMEQAVMIGTNTVLMDNPKLTTRLVNGKNPLRVVIDRNLSVPKTFNIYNSEARTIIFNTKKNSTAKNISFVKVNFNGQLIKTILQKLNKLNIQSIIVEGGANLLQQLIDKNLWDEARVFTSKQKIASGVSAPVIKSKPAINIKSENITTSAYKNGKSL